jgi:hypothetical protein
MTGSETGSVPAVKTRSAGVIVIVAGGLLAVGCSSGGSSQTASSTTPAPAFDVCSISPDILRRVGQDPTTRDVAPPSAHGSDCGWQGTQFDLGLVDDSTMTMDDVRTHPGNHNFTQITVDGRTGLLYNDGDDNAKDNDESCVATFPLSAGGAVGITTQKVSSPQPACQWLQTVLPVLLSAVPR